MKTAENILNENDLTGKLKCYDSNLNERDRTDIIYAMEEYGKLMYNQALDDAVDLYRNPNNEDAEQDNFDLDLLNLKK